jgi:hypothetical protein
MSHTPPVSEEIPNLSIDGNGRLAPRDQARSPMNPTRVKTLASEFFLKEAPDDAVIRFFKVQF